MKWILLLGLLALAPFMAMAQNEEDEGNEEFSCRVRTVRLPTPFSYIYFLYPVFILRLDLTSILYSIPLSLSPSPLNPSAIPE